MSSPRRSMSSAFADIVYADSNVTGYSALVEAVLEYVPELQWPWAGDVYARMRNDGQISGSLRAYTLPVRRASWALDPAGCRPTVWKQIADDLGLPVLGQEPKATGARRRRVNWSEHLRVALLSAPFGHMPFSQTWDMSSGSARLVRLRERMPKTIARIVLDSDDEIDFVEQEKRGTDTVAPRIPSSELVWYVNEREGAAWRGRSLMRPSYAYWLMKDEMLRVHATSNRRFGMGVPYIQDQPGATEAQRIENARAAQGLRAGETSGGSVPDGAKLQIAGMVGSVPDTLGFVKYLDHMISTSFLTQWMNLGTSDSGNRAIAEVFVDQFLQCVQDFGDQHADQATTQIVVPLVDANWGEDEPAPRIVCGNVGANHAVTAQAMSDLYTCGALTSDPEIENHIRELYKLPLRDPNKPVVQPAADVPAKPEPIAAAPVQGHLFDTGTDS